MCHRDIRENRPNLVKIKMEPSVMTTDGPILIWRVWLPFFLIITNNRNERKWFYSKNTLSFSILSRKFIAFLFEWAMNRSKFEI